MLIFKKIKNIEKHLKKLRKHGLKIGFAPTMGALHKGHVSLIKASKKDRSVTICSIFVNPTQFNDPSDYEKYPVTIDKDIEMLLDAGCDILFLPSVKEMYPGGFQNKKPIKFGYMAKILEGEHRPGHFDGMAQIMFKLLEVIQPHKLYMGQKDYQQVLIVCQLIKKMRLRTEMVMCPIIREKSGLAMSSRNARLDAASLKLAVEISKALKMAKSNLRHKTQDSRLKTQDSRHETRDIQKIQDIAMNRLSSLKGLDLEYFEILNADTLQAPTRKSEKLIALVAVKVGGVRLIDNMMMN